MRHLVLAFVAAAALAQPAPNPEPEPREYTFEPEEVRGGTDSPDAQPTVVRLQDPHPSLIRVRPDFEQELLQSAEDL